MNDYKRYLEALETWLINLSADIVKQSKATTNPAEHVRIASDVILKLHTMAESTKEFQGVRRANRLLEGLGCQCEACKELKATL